MKQKPSPAAIVILVSGAVMLIASFLPFYEISAFGFSESRNAWSGDLFAPVSLLPVLFGVVLAVEAALVAFTEAKLPEAMLGLRRGQIHLVLGVQSAVMMIAFLLTSSYGLDRGTGFWLMLLAGIGLAVGVVLESREPAGTAG